MARTGRPKTQIDRAAFESLCGIQCTEREIAYFFRCSEDTINNWCKVEYGQTFSEVQKKYAVAGKISLRRAQMRLAEKNASMAIWLGKQYLGQRDDIVQSWDDRNDILESLLKLETEGHGIQREAETADTGSL